MPVIPQELGARIQEVQRANWDALDGALDTLGDKISARARIAMDRIRRARYSQSVIKRETKALLRYGERSTARALANQIKSAALYAQRASDVIRAWQIAGSLLEGNTPKVVSDSVLARARRAHVAGIDAEAALTRIKFAPLRNRKEVDAALREFGAKVELANYTGPKTSGMKVVERLRKVGLMKRSREIGLSTRLHLSAAKNTADTEMAIGQAIREADGMDKAGRDLLSAMKSPRPKLARPLQRLREAGDRLNELATNASDTEAVKAARAEWSKQFERVKEIAESRVDSRAGYLEAMQRLDVEKQLDAAKAPYRYRVLKVKKDALDRASKKEIDQWIVKEQTRRLDKALSRWLDEKQRFHAERIVETETSAAYRAREYEQHANKPYIKGFYWRRSAGMVALDKKRKNDIFRARESRRAGRSGKRKTKGRPCTVCPSLADQFFPTEYAREFPRGAHPMCRCWYEWVYDNGALAQAPVTQDDLDWFASLED